VRRLPSRTFAAAVMLAGLVVGSAVAADPALAQGSGAVARPTRHVQHHPGVSSTAPVGVGRVAPADWWF
jgi:hypothetical protein